MARLLLALGIVLSSASCSLLIDTGGFTNDAASDGPDAAAPDVSVESAAIEQDSGTDSMPATPCTGTFLLCETFDGPAAIGLYPDQTDPTTKISIDTSSFVSPPGSALFAIEPSSNMSADATLRMQTPEPVLGFSIDAQLFVEYGEPNQPARIFEIEGSGPALRFQSTGVLREDMVRVAELGPLPLQRWLPLHIEVRQESPAPTAVLRVGSAVSGTMTLSDGWLSPATLLFRFGVSEANAPATGWRVRWDDIVIRKL